MKFLRPIKEFAGTLFRDVISAKVDGRYQIFDSTLRIDGYGENYVVLGGKRYYGVSISYYSNDERKHIKLPGTMAQYNYSEDARIYLFLVKNEFSMDRSIAADPQYKIWKESIYLFTPLEHIAQETAKEFDTEMMNSLELLQAIFDIVQINEYYNDPLTYRLKSNMEYDSFPFMDSPRLGFKKTFAEGVYNQVKDYHLYISNSVNFLMKEIDLHSFFAEDWRGYVFFYFDFCAKRVEQKAKMYQKEAQRYESNYYVRQINKDFFEMVKSTKKNDLAIFQSVMLVDNPYVASSADTQIGISYVKKSVFKKDIIYKTPLLERDMDFDIFFPTERVGEYIKSIHKRHNVKTRRPNTMWGRDITGNYITYSISESARPHFGIFAPTRTGKSFFLQKMVSQIIRYDTREEVKLASRLGPDAVQIRFFDVGESARKFAKDLTENHKEQVLFYGDDIANIRFSFTDLETDENGEIDENDLEFVIGVMNILLEVNGEEPLHATEREVVMKAYKSVFKKREYDGLYLSRLQEISGFEDVVAQIYFKYPELKNDNFVKTIDLPKEFDFLRKPLLDDIINHLEVKKSNMTVVDDLEKEAISRAIHKLKAVNSFEMFKWYSKGDIANSDFFYMELSTLKNLGDKIFIPAFWFIFRKLYNKDVRIAAERKRREEYVSEKYYIIEEAHNYIKYESFKDLFEVIGREAAKYKISIGFVTQYARDLPEAIINSLGTKIILPSVDKKDQIEDLRYIWKEKEDYLEFFRYKSQRYNAIVDYDYGIFTIKPPISERELWLFNSEAR